MHLKKSKLHILQKEPFYKIIRAFIDPEVIVHLEYITGRFGGEQRWKSDIFAEIEDES